MGGEMTMKMIELDIGPHIGLPEEPNTQNFLKFWKEKKHSVHYVTLLVQILNTEEDMTKLNLRLKMSAFERDLGHFIIKHRNNGPHDLKFWQKTLLMNHKYKSGDVREWIIQAIMCDENSDRTLQEFKTCDPPKFPINGNDLKDKGV